MRSEPETKWSSDVEAEGPLWSPAAHRRLVLVVIAALCIVLLVVLPPYIGISRYQRRVASAISGSLGRPVHFDRLSLHLLPLPGLRIENFVVSESPEFGSEPVLRANTVEARVRFASLWRRRIEVSRISLDAPSINLVRRPETGTWNLQSIVMQASRMNSAPTAQRTPGPAPRFPYIEATDARINIKNGIDKLPFSVKEADFALWLPEPDEWHVRLSGKPVRTDTDVNDVGLLRVEGTLGRANDVASAPIELSANWKRTPLGEASKLTAGYDLRWRGEISADASLHGTVGNAKLTADAHVRNLRRADFVPEQMLDLDVHCEAITGGLLRSLNDVRCALPTDNDTSIFSAIDTLRSGTAKPDAATGGLLKVESDVPDVLDWRTATLHASMQGAKPAYALAWMRLFTGRMARDLKAEGTLSLDVDKEGSGDLWTGELLCMCVLTAPAPEPSPEAPAPHTGKAPAAGKPLRWNLSLSHAGEGKSGEDAAVLDGSITEAPPGAAATEAAGSSATGETDSGRVVAHLQLGRSAAVISYPSADDARLAAAVLPQLGDDLPAGMTGVVRSVRTWSGVQAWSAAPPTRTRPEARRHRR